MKIHSEQIVERLGEKPTDSEEQILFIVNKLPKFELRLNTVTQKYTPEWQNYREIIGLGKKIHFLNGDGVIITWDESGKDRIEIPNWAREKLHITKQDSVCITKKGKQYFLKKFTCTECECAIPGVYIFDTFSPYTVERTYIKNTDVDEANLKTFRQLIRETYHLQRATPDNLESLDGWAGFLFRKYSKQSITKIDQEFLQAEKKALIEKQQKDGSWDSNVVSTSFALIKLFELGATKNDDPIAKGIQYLLDYPEPISLPGLFLFSKELTEKYNQWKMKPERKGRPLRGWSNKELDKYLEHTNIKPILISKPCEPRLTWSSAIAIEALIRIGYEHHHRVNKAINTLLELTYTHVAQRTGIWCGCGYLDAKYTITENVNPPDFNSDKLDFEKANRFLSVWGNERIDRLVYGAYKAINFRRNTKLLVRTKMPNFLCNLNMHLSLSYHSQYAQSRLEKIGVLSFASVQNSIGEWPGIYYSSIMNGLINFNHPCIEFLLLRSVPFLCREQLHSGYWREPRRAVKRSSQAIIYDVEPPTTQESTSFILKALKKYHIV